MIESDLEKGFVCFGDQLTLAESYLARGNLMAAARLAQLAAYYAFHGRGLFASPRLENLVLKIGRQIPTDPVPAEPARTDGIRNVLHVLTHAQPIGGDSRFAWRWMQWDQNSRHSVAITTQASVEDRYEIPEIMKEAAAKSGGSVHALKAPPSDPLAQAIELRRMCQKSDFVALHLYPYDIVPVLALATGCDAAKVILVNHADHIFWVGGSISHCIAHLRRQSTRFLEERRQLHSKQSSTLPIPVVPRPSTLSKAEAKKKLGYNPDAVLLLTVATKFKYSAPHRTGFLELVTPVVRECPEVIVVAIGSAPEGKWLEANAETGGRILALGVRWDTELFYTAADIYLDSVPFSSITSLLEAGSQGVPLLGFKSTDPELHLLGPGAPGLDDAMELATEPNDYRHRLTRLIKDTEFRRTSGVRVQQAILSFHTGQGWLRQLDDTYRMAGSAGSQKCLAGTTDRFASDPLTIALVHLYSSVAFSERSSIRYFIGTLAYPARLSITWRLFQAKLELCILNILPPPLDYIVHRGGRWLKNLKSKPASKAK